MPAARRDYWPKTLAYFATFVAIGAMTASLGPTLPGLAEHTHVQLDAISFLFTAHSLGYLLSSFFTGRLYDRMPGHPLMGVTLIVMAALLVLVPLAPVLWLLAACWLVLGVGGGALDVGGNTLLVWVHGRQMGPFMNALHFFFGVGAFLGPLIVAQALALSGDITWAYWALALLVLPVALWLLSLHSPSSPSVEDREASADRDPVKRAKTRAAERRTVVLVSLFLLLYVGAEGSFGGWIYTYAVAQDLSDATTAAYLTSAFWGALTLGRLLGIPIAGRYRPRWILLVDLLGSLACAGVLLLWPHSPPAVWLGSIGMGLAMASIFPTAISLAERRVPITGQVTGWFFVGASLGGMTVPWLIGQFFEPVGPQIAIVIISLALLAALGVLIAIVKTDPPDEPSGSGTP